MTPPQVDDSFRSAGELVSRTLDPTRRDEPAPYAGCPSCMVPLISTMEQPRAEFHCMVCGGWFGFLAPVALAPTEELDLQMAVLQRRFDAGERGPTA